MKSTKDVKHSPAPGADERAVLDALRKGYHERDAALLASVYADDVEFTICNRNNPPARRLVLRGREAVRHMFEEFCAREMTHRIGHPTIGDGTLAFSAHCHYPDGCQVMGLNVLTLRNGQVASEINVACWDE